MKLEDQVANLDISGKLKELGARQESLFWWVEHEYHMWDIWFKVGVGGYINHEDKLVSVQPDMRICSAFTVADLGELLPVKNNITISIKKGSKVFHVYYWWGTPNLLRGEGVTDYWHTEDSRMVNAMGKMLIYLLENKLIES